MKIYPIPFSLLPSLPLSIPISLYSLLPSPFFSMLQLGSGGVLELPSESGLPNVFFCALVAENQASSDNVSSSFYITLFTDIP